MMYIVYYLDDNHKQHMAFVHFYKDVKSLRDKFGEVTVESYKI